MCSEPQEIISGIISSLMEGRRATEDRKEQKRLDRRIAQAQALASSRDLSDIVESFLGATPAKVMEFPKQVDQTCPWCERAFSRRSAPANRFCPECRKTLLSESKEVLLFLLGRVTTVNLMLTSVLPVEFQVLHNVARHDRESRRLLAPKAGVGSRKERQEL